MPEPSTTFAAFAVYAEQSGLFARLRAIVDALFEHRNFSLVLMQDSFGARALRQAIAERDEIDGEIVLLRSQISARKNAISAAAFLS